MKRFVYYLSPFIVIPTTMGLLWLVSLFTGMHYAVVWACLAVAAGGIGLFSPARGRFDAAISCLVPLALFLLMLVLHFLDSGETYVRFDLAHAVRATLRTGTLWLCGGVAVITFVASYKRFRMVKALS